MDQDICLIGLNHRTAPVEVREKFALGAVEDMETRLLTGPVREALVLSTCNRVELLVVGDETQLPGHVLDAWAGAVGRTAEELSPHVYVYTGGEAVNHVFRVAASLDSMIVGEPQILGQLKEAYRKSVACCSARVIVNRLLHKAFFVAKKVRSQTEIASSAVSISFAAVALAKKIFGELAGKKAMLIGAGEMAELAATHLLTSGIAHIYVANRTFARAEELAERYRGTPIPFGELYLHLPEVDIVISSTGSPTAVIFAKDVKAVLKKRKHRPMFFIDIAVPRDIDPDVNSLDNVYLYDIDDLREVVEENLAGRREEARKAEAIVEEETAAFSEWLSALDLHPTIRDLLDSGREIGQRELAKTLRRLGPDATPQTREALEILVNSLTRKLYHEPIVFLKRRAQEEGKSQGFIDLARRMFNLDRDNVPDDAHFDRRQPGAPGGPDAPDSLDDLPEACPDDGTLARND
jgi:glutamyl-tRNA reductase